MKKTILKSTVSAAALALLLSVNAAVASEVTGNLSTGLTANNGTTVNGVVIAPPNALPVAGTYTSAQTVALSAHGATSIRYSIDGTVPSCTDGTLYSSQFEVSASLTVKAIACYANDASSTVASYDYVINPTPATAVQSSGGSSSSGGGGGGSSYTPAQSSGKSDMNNDGKVNILDFVTLMADWGKTGSGITADVNSDGKVDIMDFVSLMANWTK